jgi:hypothetical protein
MASSSSTTTASAFALGDLPSVLHPKVDRSSFKDLIRSLRETNEPEEEYVRGRVYTIAFAELASGRASIPKGLARRDLYEMEHELRVTGNNCSVAFWWPLWVETNDIHVDECRCQVCRWHIPQRQKRIAEGKARYEQKTAIYAKERAALNAKKAKRRRWCFLLALIGAIAFFVLGTRLLPLLLLIAVPCMVTLPLLIGGACPCSYDSEEQRVAALSPDLDYVGDGRINKEPWLHEIRGRPISLDSGGRAKKVSTE